MTTLLLRPRRRLFAILAAVLFLGGVFAVFDLRGRGALWRYLYSLTGEVDPFPQLYAYLAYLGNVTRRLPNTADEIATNYPVENPLGVNTFLELEPELAKRERQMIMIAEAGIGWMRQKFTWQDIEIHGRGDFMDRRNDMNGDGTPDPVDAWLKYDTIVDLANEYGVKIIARLGTPPAWSQPEGVKGTFAPPEDLQDYVNYAAAVITRYKGRIRHVQVWNEPNLEIEWGGQPVSPERYTEMLCRTYQALKAIDPEIVVITGALAPTVDISGYNLNPNIFLQRMYDAGAKPCFDILGGQGYGLFSGPTDRRVRITTINFNYPMWLRDVMIANGDGEKPIWIGEMAWNPVPDAETAPDMVGRYVYGQVTDEQGAQYVVDAYQRVREEWKWTGVICYWYFKRPDESEKNQSWYYFRMVDPDFTPRPVYAAVKAYAEKMGYKRQP
ncbi:MAG TPA: hypothetical protein PLD47_14410 [Aggregatilineales bacterium]|nr:hypothetical protein [Anaerolineales bacterium]HRE48916.1 hypothetical protein [Aggregatilineales bacterium]